MRASCALSRRSFANSTRGSERVAALLAVPAAARASARKLRRRCSAARGDWAAAIEEKDSFSTIEISSSTIAFSSLTSAFLPGYSAITCWTDFCVSASTRCATSSCCRMSSLACVSSSNFS